MQTGSTAITPRRESIIRIIVALVLLASAVLGAVVRDGDPLIRTAAAETSESGNRDLAKLAQPVIGAGECVFFAETNRNLCDVFLNYWRQYGGLEIFGFPLSWEIEEDGLTVQYFERARLEYHPELAGSEWAVVGELLGRTVTRGRDGETPFRRIDDIGSDANCTYFPETGHRLCFGFRGYWESHGGLWMFGYPISEEFQERNPDTGKVYTVQYFERARFEWHPENANTPFEVLLGRLGAQLHGKRHPNASALQRFDVRSFGARGDGVSDDTDAIQRALDAADGSAQGAGIVYLPAGHYRVRGSSSETRQALELHRGSVLVGDGVDRTRVSLIAASVQPGWPNIRLLLVDDDTRITGITFDGRRDDFDRARITNVSTTLLRTKTNSRGIVFENLRVENAYGQREGDEFKEAFGIACSQSTEVTIRQVEARNNDGAGISTGGDIYGTVSENALVENVLVWGNRSMGISFYGARSSLARGIVAWGNSRGVNIEWSQDLTIQDAEIYDNERRGVSMIGMSTGIRLVHVTTWNNGTEYLSGSEIGLVAGSWEFPDPATGVISRGINQDITLVDCTLRPQGRATHVYVKPDVNGVTVGDVFPNAMLLHSAGWEGWSFNIDNTIVPATAVPSYVQSTYGVDVRTQ